MIDKLKVVGVILGFVVLELIFAFGGVWVDRFVFGESGLFPDRNFVVEAEGPQGEQGIQGETGVTGEQGLQGESGADGLNGQNGTNGENGLTPYIGLNGHWWIGDIDTGISAQGQQGTSGANGENGSDGQNGQDGINGENGLTPYIGVNGHWWIGYIDTGIDAQGQQGTPGFNGDNGSDGQNGQDGINGENGLTPYIGVDGHWWIGDIDTGIDVQGQQGESGANGENGQDGINGLSVHYLSSAVNEVYSFPLTRSYGKSFFVPNNVVFSLNDLVISSDSCVGYITAMSIATVEVRFTARFPVGQDGEQGLQGEPGENGSDGAVGLTTRSLASSDYTVDIEHLGLYSFSFQISIFAYQNCDTDYYDGAFDFVAEFPYDFNEHFDYSLIYFQYWDGAKAKLFRLDDLYTVSIDNYWLYNFEYVFSWCLSLYYNGTIYNYHLFSYDGFLHLDAPALPGLAFDFFSLYYTYTEIDNHDTRVTITLNDDLLSNERINFNALFYYDYLGFSSLNFALLSVGDEYYDNCFLFSKFYSDILGDYFIVTDLIIVKIEIFSDSIVLNFSPSAVLDYDYIHELIGFFGLLESFLVKNIEIWTLGV
ncbi:MAG: collagen-like protein [Clostridiales bacterium]|jgi:hypothetical protein|nr:collagen-like protein [Clostridiales bacterium]